MPTRRAVSLGGLSLVAAGSVSEAFAFDGPVADFVEHTQEFADAVDAYVYGYPLVTLEMTRRVMTNVAAPEALKAPMGTLLKAREYPSAKFRDVTAPNADTLYTTAFFEVGDEPWIVALPEMNGRYALFPMLDGWTNVFSAPGKRTTGTGPQTYAVVGPDWKGELPQGVVKVRSPTSLVWLLGRIYCTGTPEDYKAVHALQDQIKIYPLSAWGKAWTPPAGKVDPSIDMKTAVREQVNAFDAVDYFTLLAELMKTNPPAKADGPMLEKLADVGIVPGKDFDKSKFDPVLAKRIPKVAQDRIMLHFKFSDGDMKESAGWAYTLKTGRYGTDYLQRALVTVIGLGANLPQDAVYPVSQRAGEGVLARAYQGSEKYVMTFKKGMSPPAKGFWSLTMYDDKYFFVENPIDRYSISPRQDLKANADGSVDLLIQNESPGPDKESNWLPAPKGKFILMLRLYWPSESDPTILNGSWTPPAVRRV
ncbi:DUF1254 domain-containing protein [Methylocella sp.]|uniref:DUF1254 domain-containing protein n=1 Tax=Methylocella sp. TaxID=1978226 RepID=UPI0037850958